jgi:hypothetical protein
MQPQPRTPCFDQGDVVVNAEDDSMALGLCDRNWLVGASLRDADVIGPPFRVGDLHKHLFSEPPAPYIFNLPELHYHSPFAILVTVIAYRCEKDQSEAPCFTLHVDQYAHKSHGIP